MAKLKKLETKHFNKKLALNQWLMTQFGINPLDEKFLKPGKVRPLDVLASTLRKSKPGLSADRHHFYLHDLLTHWQSNWQYSEQQLKNFDENIVAHLDLINERRDDAIEWKYFQWLSLLFVEMYLYEFFNDRYSLLNKLNNYLAEFNKLYEEQGYEAPLAPYTYEELNKLCLQNATGSGKTLLMHCNVLQFQHYAKRFAKLDDYSQVILISPNERLSKQHLIELSDSGFSPSRLAQSAQQSLTSEDSPFADIKLTEITKLSDTQGDKMMDVASFGDQNLLLVDEGHRGLGTADSETGWLASRRKLAGNGFTFEYSATFKEAVVAAKNQQVEMDYAKSVVFDYAYRYFYEDGYGKDYRIFNLPNKQEDIIHQKPYLTAALLAFYQQLRLFQDRKAEFEHFNLEMPLWVFVGASVVKDDGKLETAQNYAERASDIAKVLKFFGWVLSNKAQAIQAIDSVLNTNAKTAGLEDEKGNDIFGSSFPYLKNELKLSAAELFKDLCEKVFQSYGGGQLVIERITGDSGELLLKVGESSKPFGLINVGDAKGLADHLESSLSRDEEAEQLDCDIRIDKSEFASPLFAQIEAENSPVNILIGSKKFVEGWNSWRVSSMGLMNTGRREGSQIIQLFGRGVRLRGRDRSLMRSSRYLSASAPKYVQLLETLNVFGVGSDFIATFKNYLADEGLPGNEDTYIETVKLTVVQGMGERLKMLRPKVRQDTQQTYSFSKDGPLVLLGGTGDDLGIPPKILKQGRKLVLDRRPNMRTMTTKELEADGSVLKVSESKPVHFDGIRANLLRYDQLYLALNRYVQSRGYANLLVQKAQLQPLLLHTSWYEIHIPDNQWSMASNNIRLWQELALELLCLLADKVHNFHKRSYLEPRLELVTLNSANDNLPIDSEYTITVDASSSALVDDIQQLKQAFEEHSEELFDSGRESIKGIKLDEHLFNPLLCATSDRIKVQPVGLELSEFQFIEDLKSWLASNQGLLKQTGEEVYLLRNMVRKGIGFFEAGGFYPDFILWRLWKDEKGQLKQRIAFVDPHGILRTGIGDDKIEFSQKIKDVQARLNDEVELESVIISPPKTTREVIQAQWKVTATELASSHVFFMSDKDKYIQKLMDLVRQGLEDN